MGNMLANGRGVCYEIHVAIDYSTLSLAFPIFI